MKTLRSHVSKIVICTVMLLALHTSPAFALPDEYLYCDLPRGWSITASRSSPRESFTEIRPEGERANGWSEIVTVQTLF